MCQRFKNVHTQLITFGNSRVYVMRSKVRTTKDDTNTKEFYQATRTIAKSLLGEGSEKVVKEHYFLMIDDISSDIQCEVYVKTYVTVEYIHCSLVSQLMSITELEM